MNPSDPEFSSWLRRQLARSDESARICSVCDEAVTECRDEDGEPVCEDCRPTGDGFANQRAGHDMLDRVAQLGEDK